MEDVKAFFHRYCLKYMRDLRLHAGYSSLGTSPVFVSLEMIDLSIPTLERVQREKVRPNQHLQMFEMSEITEIPRALPSTQGHCIHSQARKHVTYKRYT